MIWLSLVLLAAIAVAPLALTLRRTGAARGRREAALALHRAQLVELDRDLAEGRIAAPEHATALLEVQRRLLAAAAVEEAAPTASARGPLIGAIILVPVAALALYLPWGSPDMPAEPIAARRAEMERNARAEAALIAQLQEKIAALDPRSEQARAGFVLLGNVEGERGNLPAAADAWQRALAARFDPGLAAQTAEALSRVAGRVTPEAEQLFQEALAKAPGDAPWRGFVEERLKKAKEENNALQ